MPDNRLLLEQILEVQQKTTEDISDLKVIIARQEEHLKYHILRTDLAEENIKLLREELKPVQKHVGYVNGFLKVIGSLSVILGFVISVFKIVTYLG